MDVFYDARSDPVDYGQFDQFSENRHITIAAHPVNDDIISKDSDDILVQFFDSINHEETQLIYGIHTINASPRNQISFLCVRSLFGSVQISSNIPLRLPLSMHEDVFRKR
jgi:hypothetical protein